jgi:hypothetical protein
MNETGGNCATASPENPERMSAAFRAGTGGCTRRRIESSFKPKSAIIVFINTFTRFFN